MACLHNSMQSEFSIYMDSTPERQQSKTLVTIDERG